MSEDEPQRPKRLGKRSKDIAQVCDRLQKKCADTAKQAGCIRDMFYELSTYLGEVPDNPVFGNTEIVLNKFYGYISAEEQKAKAIPNIESRAFSVVGSSTASIVFAPPATWLPVDNTVPSFKPPLNLSERYDPERMEKYASYFDKIDIELGKTYRSVREIFYGTSDSPEKNALYAMRNAYDHLFRILAPDEEVRKSEHFIPKEDSEPEKVYRRERYIYAANAHVKDKAWAEVLISAVDLVLRTHDELSKAHSQKALDRDKVREVINAMYSILEQWADALDLGAMS